MFCDLQVVDVLDQVADRFEAFGLAEVDVALLLEVADQLDHVEGVDAEGLERGLFVDGFGLDIQVVLKNFFDGGSMVAIVANPFSN